MNAKTHQQQHNQSKHGPGPAKKQTKKKKEKRQNKKHNNNINNTSTKSKKYRKNKPVSRGEQQSSPCSAGTCNALRPGIAVMSTMAMVSTTGRRVMGFLRRSTLEQQTKQNKKKALKINVEHGNTRNIYFGTDYLPLSLQCYNCFYYL
jgi:hypothetical protein